MQDTIEILTETLIDRHPDLALEVLAASSRLGRPLGWHYVLDIVWLLRELRLPAGATVLDAGAGWGVTQFMLADLGYRVISADVSPRRPPAEFSHLYRFEQLGSQAAIEHAYLERPGSRRIPRLLHTLLATPPRALPALVKDTLRDRYPWLADGRRAAASELPAITLYHCDIGRMTELDDDSVDAVVSVSALEHNPPDKVVGVVRELERVARAGAPLLLTVSGSREPHRYHAASRSYLMNEAGFVATYGLDRPSSDYAQFDDALRALTAARYLKRWLSCTYRPGVENGMPDGVWAPDYMPVALRKWVRK